VFLVFAPLELTGLTRVFPYLHRAVHGGEGRERDRSAVASSSAILGHIRLARKSTVAVESWPGSTAPRSAAW
jgi:hypothetical protein